MAAKQDEMSRFSVKYSDQELVHMAAEIANTVNPGDPSSVTQRQFDAARKETNFPGAPRAYRFAERLNRSWKEVLELALSPGSPEKSLAARETTQIREKLTRAEVEHYLQAAARSLNVTELGVPDYDRYRQELVDVDNRKFIHRARLEETIPTSNTIIQNLGSWVKALDWAGLGHPGSRKPRIYPAEQALDDFIADYGFAPTYRMLLAYQRERGVRTEDYSDGYRAWRQAQLATGLASRHENIPVINHIAQAPDGWENRPITPVPDGYMMIRENEVNLDKCRADLQEAIRLAEGKRLTQDLYQRLSQEHHLVAMATIQKVAKREANLTWGQLRDQVVRDGFKRERTQGRHLRVKS